MTQPEIGKNVWKKLALIIMQLHDYYAGVQKISGSLKSNRRFL